MLEKIHYMVSNIQKIGICQDHSRFVEGNIEIEILDKLNIWTSY